MTRTDLGITILVITVLIILFLWVKELLKQYGYELESYNKQLTETEEIEIPTFYEENEDIPNHERQD